MRPFIYIIKSHPLKKKQTQCTLCEIAPYQHKHPLSQVIKILSFQQLFKTYSLNVSNLICDERNAN